MPIKTWVMLESKDFTINDRIYMPLNLDGPSSGGTLRIRATLLSSPVPPVVETKPIIVLDPIDIEAPIEPTVEPILTLPGGGTATIEETQPIVEMTEPTTTVGTIPISDTRSLELDATRTFASPTSAPLSTFNIWIGRGATLVYSSRHASSFDIAVPVNFFLDVPLVESSYESPPVSGGGGGVESVVTTFRRAFGNPEVLGDFGSMFAELEGAEAPVYPTVTSDAPVTTVQKLNAGYHPCFMEVVTNGNTWRVHVEVEYDYERTGEAAISDDPPIIRNIVVNKSYSNSARISWNTDVKADRSWVVYWVGTDLVAAVDAVTVEASTGSLYPSATLQMKDGTFYTLQVFSQLKGRTSNSEPFFWKMPDANITKTGDLTIQANSETGLIGDGEVVTIESEQMLVPGAPQISIVPIIIAGGVAAAGIGGVAWYMLRRKKG